MKKIKFFVDSCDPADTQKAIALLGSIDGQTTNPTLLTKNPDIQTYLAQGKKLQLSELLSMYEQAIQAIASYTTGALSVEVYADWNTKSEEMVEQAYRMKEWSSHIYIKFPTIPEGLKAAAAFTKSGGHANMTLVFDQLQAAAVYSATQDTQGTAFVSPFVGRWDDRGFFGLNIIQHIKSMYAAFDAQRGKATCHVEILAASLRNLDHIHGAIVFGADILTAPVSAYQAWIDAGSQYSPKPPQPNMLVPIPFEELTYTDDFETYEINQDKKGLLNQGLIKFANDWNAVIER